MAKILIMLHPESSHFNACLGLAHQLIAAGHQPTFLASPKDRSWCERHQMAYEPILERSFGSPSKKSFFPLSWFATRREIRLTFEEFTADLERILDPDNLPDLFLVDGLMPYAAFVAGAYSVPILMVHTTLPTTRYGDIPPLTCDFGPPQTEPERQRINKIWRIILDKKARKDGRRGLSKAIKRMAEHFRFDTDQINTDDVFTFDLPFPKLVLCARAFDFPRPGDADHHYLGPYLYLDRKEVDFPFDWLREDRDLIYCATTTRRSDADDTLVAAYRALLEAVAEMPDCQLVLSTCGLDLTDALTPPENAKVVRYAPQLALLQRADLAIHHGGLNTVKECLHFGVPSLVFPGRDDQLGNAARIAHHKLGLIGEADDLRPERLRALIQQVRKDSEIAASVRRFQTEHMHNVDLASLPVSLPVTHDT